MPGSREDCLGGNNNELPWVRVRVRVTVALIFELGLGFSRDLFFFVPRCVVFVMVVLFGSLCMARLFLPLQAPAVVEVGGSHHLVTTSSCIYVRGLCVCVCVCMCE